MQWRKFHTDRIAITAGALLNDSVIPFFDEQKIPLLRMLEPKPILHKPMAYVKDFIEVCRIHEPILSLEKDLQFFGKSTDLCCVLVAFLNSTTRPDSSKYCYGPTAMQTFFDGKHIAFQNNISSITQRPDSSFDYANASAA